MRRLLGVGVLALACMALCLSCAAGPRYQLPQTDQQLQSTVNSTEQAYQALYMEYKAQRLTKAAMAHVDELYQAWRSTQQMLIDAVRAGAVGIAP